MKVKSESEVTQSCPTLRNPMDCRLPCFSIPGIFQARVLKWVAIAFSKLGSRRAQLFYSNRKCEVKVAQSCPTLCDPKEFSRPEYWSG